MGVLAVIFICFMERLVYDYDVNDSFVWFTNILFFFGIIFNIFCSCLILVGSTFPLKLFVKYDEFYLLLCLRYPLLGNSPDLSSSYSYLSYLLFPSSSSSSSTSSS